MGFWDDLKFNREAYKEFKSQVAVLKNDVVRHGVAEQQARLKLDKLLELQETGLPDESYFKNWNLAYVWQLQEDPKSLEMSIVDARQDWMRWHQTREKAEKELAFLRPNTRLDVAERKAAFADFADEVLAVDPEGVLDLRFHSTTLAATKDIIMSGGLMSSVDRLDGFLETTNYSNEISVSDIQNIQYSINYWTDINGYNGCRPCGCMFVLQPRTQEEADMIPGRQMHNVLFQKNPEQLVAIVTTSENVGRVQDWLHEAGLLMDNVYRFDEFAARLKIIKDTLIPIYKVEREKDDICNSLVSSVDAVISGAQIRSYCTSLGKSHDLSNGQILGF